MARTAKIAAAIAAILVFLAVAGIVILYLFDWNRMRPEIANRLTEATGRAIEIRGDLDLRLSWRPEIIARDVTVANAEWGSQPEMATAEEIRLRLRIPPLLRGRIQAAQVHLVRPTLLLETDGERTNWSFAVEGNEDEPPEESAPVIEHVSASNARVVYRSPKLKAPVEIDLEAGSYDMRSREFRLHDATAQMGENKAAGSVTGDLAENWPRAEGRLKAEGRSLRAIGDLAGYPLPLDRPYGATLELSAGERSIRIQVVDARVGDSDIKGELVVDLSAEVPHVEGKLSSEELRIDDLIEGFGQIEKQDKPTGRLLSDKPLPFDALDRVNAEIAFRGDAVWSGPLRIDGMRFDLTLENGRLSVEPLAFDTAEGYVELDLQVDARKATPEVSASLRVRGLNLKALLAAFDAEDEAAGRVNATITAAGQGRSPREIGASARGDGFVLMSGGHVGKMVLAAIAVDLQEALLEWIRGGDTMVSINCAIMPLRMREGRLFADQWVFDTTDTLVETEGFVDLGTEEVELVLMPYPKYFSLFNTLASITIEGDMGERTVDVSKLEVARNFVLKSLGAPLMPLVSPFIQEEAEKRDPCGEMLSRLRGDEAAPPPR